MKKVIAIAVVALLIVVAAFAYLRITDSMQPQRNHPSIVNTSTLGALPQKDASGIDTSHLEEGVTPPTNKWFSGLALQKEPKPVFPLPQSFLAKEDSFELGLPVVDTTAKTIFGAHRPDVQVVVKDATSYKVSRYDELTVDLTYYNNKEPLGTLTLTAGSPLMFFVATQKTSLSVSTTEKPSVENNAAKIKLPTATTHIAAFENASVTASTSEVTATIPAEGFVTLYQLPNSSKDVLSAVAGNRVTGSDVEFAQADETYETSLSLHTANSKPTALGLLPHHTSKQKTTSALQYETIYGPSKVSLDNNFRFTTPVINSLESLDVSTLSAADKDLLVTTLRRDINATTFAAEDSYFGGKGLYRAAQLLELAHQLDETQIAASIQQKLRREMVAWLSISPREKKSFYYDTRVNGIVGQTIAFGSEEFNDHHFHYGYFIYAASVLAKYDADFLNQHKDMINLLVADIANYNKDETLPLRRSFDPYTGHSWASGSSPFGDGNNQESSSEAINAWVGVNLWASQTKNSALKEQASWMLSNEVASTAAYWMNFDTTQPAYDGYEHEVVSLNWGGKRDYGTFFSAEPNAMLGILLIPMSPTTIYQSAYGDRIARHVEEALPTMDTKAQFADYILMYSALGGTTDQLDIAKDMPDETIDGANSRSYLYAWIMSRK
ncbi:MAG: Endo-1,3(4)-beta-glucanase [Candidatus Saccharibacteria bacterium GW2011_GWC2_48_9]|nr:MAG: Endo-1,3(4)-beta-glucanase [Candidatus Saccharibacteria bacterium GW2011_GWC2_48_9]HCH34625.1 hypothetical protein [Candidatus Saccharibacteria bacterium]